MQKEEIKCNKIIKQYKKWLTLTMLQMNTEEYNPNWPKIPDNLYRILIIGDPGSGKTNSFFQFNRSDIGIIFAN